MTPKRDAGSDDGELLALLASGRDLNSFLDDLVHLAARQVPRSEACGLTLNRDSTGVTVASTGPLADRADERQYEVDTGPCLESMRTGTVVRVRDMATEERWAPYPERAARLGVRSSLSLPLVVEGRSSGALNLYATEPGVFSDDDEATAAGWAEQRCTADQAFDLLRIASQRRNVKLRDVAAGVVAAFEEGLGDRRGRW